MPSSELQSKLAELLELLDETPSQHTVEKCNNLIGEIQLICLRTTSENELAYHCSVVFHKETGILLFLKKTITIDQYVSSKERILEFVYNFMIRADKKIVTYALDIKDVCLSLFTRDKMAKIKNRTFPILNKLLELTANTPVAKELGVSKLIDKYFSQLMQPSKLAATVKHGIYHLLGVFAQYYPELMTKYSDRLLNVYMKALKDQMLSKTKQAELPVVAGCLLGLTHLLVNFTQSVEEEAPHAWDIFRFTRMAIDPKVGYTRFDVPKTGLWLLAKHAPQFNKYLLDDHEEMYDKLFSWCQHHNRDMKSAGYASLEAFLKQVASMLVEEGNKDKRNKTTIFKAFIRKFRSIIDNRESGTREICIAIKGYGLFAAPCKLFLSEDDVKFMFNEMIQRSEQLYFSQNELVDETIPHLPSFLEALACIVRELDEVSDTFLSSLETMTVILMENFPRFGKALHYTCYKSITAVLVALSPKGATLRNFVSRIVYQGLIRTCSHPVVLEGEMYDVSGDETSDELLIDARKVSYKDYLDLWNHLLDSSQLRITDIGLSPQDCKVLHNIVYDELIAAIIRILGKLDLSSNKDGQLGNELSADPEPGTSDGRSSPVTDLSSDPSSGLTPSKPKDFQIFINLVEFCRDFLPKRCPYYFERWVYTFGHEVIVHSTRLPLVSGFYKLLSVCMTISQNIGYFQGINENAKVAVPRHIEEKASTKDMCTLADKVAAFHLFKKFTKEVLIRLKQYKDDLLASCLFLVLALPHEIIASDVAAIVPALQTTFRIGLGYLPLAHAGLDALETWAFRLQHNALQPYYKDILPCLDGYLKTVSDTNAENASSQTVSLTMTRTGKRRNKIPIRLLKPATQDGSDESPLTIVKLKIVHLLGLLGGSTNGYLLESSKEEIAKKAVAWDTENHLQFPVPFMDIKPVICFDPFLPRVVELATTSSDRQTKVSEMISEQSTQEQCVRVVDHLERIIRVKANMLNRTSKTRRVPRDFNRDDCPTLSHVVTWLLLQCGRLQTECRHQCMILVCKLIPLLPGNNSASTWMHRTMAEKGRGPDYFITRFEGGGGKGGHKTGISKHPTLNTVDKTFSVKVASNWFDLFLAALDCYTWVFGEKLLGPIELFAGKANKPTNVFKSVDFFLSKLALEDVYAAAKCITSSSAGLIFTPREIDDYNKYKCTAIVRLLDFISVLLAVHTKDLSKSIPLSFWSTNLFEVIVSCVLDPSSVGFDLADIEVISNLPKTTGQLLMFMTQKAPGNVSSEMKKCLQEKLKPKSHMHLMNITPSILKGDDKGINYVKLTHMVSGYEQLHKANLLLPALQKTGSLGLHGWFSQLVELSKMSNHSPSPPIAKYVLPENMAAQCYHSLNTGMASGDKFSQQLLTAVFESISTKQSNSLIVSHLSPTAHELAVRLLDLAFLLASQSKELVSCLMNKTPVKTGRVDSSAGYCGLSFYSHFKVPINTQLAQHGQEVVPLLLRHVVADSTIVSTILNGLLDHITNNRELRKKKGLTVHAAILSNWSSLKSWWSEGATHDQRSSTLILLKKLLQIDSKFASDPTHAAFKPVFDMYLNMVTDSNTSLAFKSRVLEILYFFTRIPEQELSLLQGRLNRLIADNFPLKSSEFVVGSPKYNDYVAAFGKILSALVISGSLMLLELLISIMCREPKHVCEDQIQASLITFIKHLPADKQKPAVDVAFDVFHKENVYPNDIRRAALERVGLPLLRLVDIPTLSTFFISHVNQIMNTIEAKQIKVPESSFETQLVSKIGCFELMEVLYSRMTKEELNTPQSKVNKIYCRDSVKSGKEMTMALTKIAHAAKGEDIRGESVLVELRRQYHCAAYNALVAIVSCTQNDIKFYNGFLFAENHAKGQFFLDNLVDADKVYHFEIEMESPMERKKKFVAIRKEVRDASEEDDLQDSAVGLYGTGGVRYLSSQYLADSSLSEEISQFDMNTGCLYWHIG
uniref:DNA-dependent protein kinase catalytic subunit-like n=1 Tax=Saccoglossus kowalevskii TaxID=10224 RepID=A0ABM0LWD5_SACKO|nr:PREDICTED: DNA-dependent protein kinase catalytic subunit-like [Saccoglossus kowalevskii]